MNDQEIYRQISQELARNETDPAAWTQAFAEAGGEADKTRASYIKLRFAVLKSPTPNPADAAPANRPPTVAASSELTRLRAGVADRLAVSGKASFYRFFGLSPTADDGEVADAISAHQGRISAGQIKDSPEFRYAREALQNPAEREKYDRRLFEQLTALEMAPNRLSGHSLEVAPESGFMDWWLSRKTTFLAGVASVVVLGYLGLSYFGLHGATSIRKDEVAIQRDVARSSGENQRDRVQNERIAIEGGLAVADKALERSSELRHRALAIDERAEDRRRQELEYRASTEAQVIEMRRQEQERRFAMAQERQNNAKADGERQYWACMKLMSNRASGQCEHYRR